MKLTHCTTPRALLVGLAAAGAIAAFSFQPRSTLIVPQPVAQTPTVFASPTPTPEVFDRQLSPIPSVVKAVYLTGYSAGLPKKINEIINLAKTTELNAVVIDVKDYAGKVFFKTTSTLIHDTGAEEERIPNFPQLVRKLHEQNIYVIARIAVFQDVNLALKRPELAVKDSSTGAVWRDNKNLAWVDPASREVWDYNIAVAREAIKRGVDEVNLDYIRFPSDGNLDRLKYPVYNAETLSQAQQIRKFFEYFGEQLKDQPAKTSADLFGLSTVAEGDMGIGQIIEYAFLNFDYVCPMVYPSHYASGFLQYKNPAAYPYEVVKHSLDMAQAKRAKLQTALAALPLNASSTVATSTRLLVEKLKIGTMESGHPVGQLRPWLQAFDLGAAYTPEMVRKQMQAAYDAGVNTGWYLWDAANRYNPADFMAE